MLFFGITVAVAAPNLPEECFPPTPTSCPIDATYVGIGNNNIWGVSSDKKAIIVDGCDPTTCLTLNGFNTPTSINPFTDTSHRYVDIEAPIKLQTTERGVCFLTDDGALHCVSTGTSAAIVDAPVRPSLEVVIEDECGDEQTGTVQGAWDQVELSDLNGIARTRSGHFEVWGTDSRSVVTGADYTLKAKDVTIANQSACLIRQDNQKIHCWGNNSKGLVSNVPTAVTAVDIECNRTLCGYVDTAGAVGWWGNYSNIAGLVSETPTAPFGTTWTRIYNGGDSYDAPTWYLQASDGSITAFDYRTARIQDEEIEAYWATGQHHTPVNESKLRLARVSVRANELCGIVSEDLRSSPVAELYAPGDVVCFGNVFPAEVGGVYTTDAGSTSGKYPKLVPCD